MAPKISPFSPSIQPPMKAPKIKPRPPKTINLKKSTTIHPPRELLEELVLCCPLSDVPPDEGQGVGAG